MMRRFAVVGILALALAGCGPAKHWSKAGATYDDFARDSRGCESVATRVYGGSSSGFHPFMSFRSSGQHADVSTSLYQACMQEQGYQHVEGGEWIGARD
jgi:hypothetical protein